MRIFLGVLAAFFSAGVSVALGSRDGKTVVVQEVVSRNEVVATNFSIDGNSQQLMQKGREFFQGERFSEAAESWEKAAAIFQETGDKLNEALAKSYLSLTYQNLGRWQEASDAISSALSVIRDSGQSEGESIRIMALALNTQAHLQLALGKPEQALEIWQEAAAKYDRIGDLEGKIGSQINQAQALQNLGLYRRARKTLEEIELSLKTQPNSLVKSTGLRSLGNALRVIGELVKSRELLEESLSIAEELGDKQAIAATQLSLGNTARSLISKAIESEDANTAKIELETALKAYRASAAISKSPLMKMQSKLNQLSLLVDNERFEEAQALLPEINLQNLPVSRRSVYAKINFSHHLLDLFKGRVKTESRDKFILDYRNVAQILASAVQDAKILQDRRVESYAIGNLAGVYEINRQFTESEKLTQQALVLAQSINALDISYRWQWQLGRLLKERGDNESAIAAYSTAVETLKSLRSDLVALNPDNPDIQFSFRDSVEPVYREFVDLLITTGKEANQTNLRQARQVIESLQLAELDNFFQEACLDAKPVQIDQVDRNIAVLYPIILPDKLAVIAALPESSLRLYTTSKPKNEIEIVLDELQQDIGRVSANNQRVLEISQQVYDWIIRPIESELQQNKVQTLVFVLDGLLRNIPMAALHDGKQYLLEKYSIALTPGLQLLPTQLLQRERLRVLSAGLSESRQGFSPLPNVEKELEQIQSQVNSQVLLNQEFTDRNFQEAINLLPFPIVHIATHGQFSSQAEKTFILAWDREINVKDLDNLLRNREQEVSRPIELLVFSACETAEGDNRAALGLAGVALRAGARTTLATLWRVSDRSTAELMVRFYTELVNTGTTKAEALRLAQLSLLQQKPYKSPYFWAPFVLVGNWR